MLDEMTCRNASKFAIFYIHENPKLLLPFFISCNFMFVPYECPVLCRHRPGYSLGKNKVARNEERKKLWGFTYPKKMANFEAFCWNNSLSIHFLFLKSGHNNTSKRRI